MVMGVYVVATASATDRGSSMPGHIELVEFLSLSEQNEVSKRLTSDLGMLIMAQGIQSVTGMTFKFENFRYFCERKSYC